MQKMIKTVIKILIAIMIVMVACIAGAFIYEKIPHIFSILGLTSLRDKGDRIIELTGELKRVKDEAAVLVGDLRSGNESLREELGKALDGERTAEESLGRETEIHQQMARSIKTAEGAIAAIRAEALRIGETADAIESEIRRIQTSGGEPGPGMEDHSDR